MKLLTFIFGDEPDKIQYNNMHNSCGPSIRDNVLNRFKDLLEAYAISSGMNRNILHITFHLN